jgi:hypothetical protein
MNENQIIKKLEDLVRKKEDLQKKQLLAYRSGASQQIKNQLAIYLQEVDFDLYNLTELRRNLKNEKDDEDDGLII